MKLTKHFTTIVPPTVIFLGLAGYGFISAQVWTSPTATPPANNAAAPVNTGLTTQTKSGNFSANIVSAATSTWSPRYCDALGGNCWDPTTGAPGGGDTIIVGGQCFEPAWAVTCNWNWSGDGNDNSTYIRPLSVSPTGVCNSVGRSYQYHTMILAQCTAAPVYAWSVGAYACNAPYAYSCQTTSGTNVRTVTCQNQYGGVGADSLCPSPKPTTAGGSCTRNGGGSDC